MRNRSFIDGRENRKKRSIFVYYFNITNFSKTPHSPPAAHALGTTDKRWCSKIYLIRFTVYCKCPSIFIRPFIYAVTVNIMIRFIVFFFFISIHMGIMDIFIWSRWFLDKKGPYGLLYGRCTYVYGDRRVYSSYYIMMAVCGVWVLFSSIKWFVLEF